jgi:branched-chain amino acid transport system ATP-binding protein
LAAEGKAALLRLEGVHAGYSDVDVLRGIDMAVEAGTVTAIIGANGAGKSTLLKAVFGLVRNRSGTIRFAGEDITSLGSRQRLGRGIVIVPQGRCNFPLLTVRENLRMAAYTRRDDRVDRDIESVCERFPVLLGKERTLAGNLSGGEQQLLEMAMSLMLTPQLVLIDEPSLGLAPVMQRRVFDAIIGLRDSGAAVLLVEQNAVQALRIADRGVVLEMGRVSHDGSGVEMLEDPDVRRSYLGLAA